MDSPGSVLHLSENLPLPFDRRVWMELNALHAQGYQVSAICPMGGKWTEPYEVIDGIHIWRYPEPMPAHDVITYVWEFAYCLLQTGWLSLRVQARHGFDVIHAANPPDTFWAIALFYKLFGKKYVFDHHDLCPELYLSRFGQDHANNLLHRMLKVLEWLQFRTADMVISTNESYRDVAMRRGGKPADRVFVVRSGPSRERFAKVRDVDESLRRGRAYMVAYLGVMAPQDGVDHLLRAAAHLVYERGRKDVSFTLVGAGDSFEDLKKMTCDLNLCDYVEFTGRIPDEDVERILATADVCACPDPKNPLNDVSTMNKVLEYMACARPIVAYDLREHRYSAGEGAIYAEPNVETELAAGIESLLDDPERRKQMGDYNRQRFLERMAWEYSAGELIRAYRTLCAPKNRV